LTLSFAYEVGTAQWGVVTGASLVAAVLDIRSRRIPNWLTLPLLVGGMVVSCIVGGLGGLASALGACLLLALPYVVLFVMGGGGAGDAKMMGAVGAWLGLEAGVVVLVCVAGIGAVFGLLRMAAHRDRRTLFGNLLASIYVWAVTLSMGRSAWSSLRPGDHEPDKVEHRGPAIPYAPAIFLGVCLGAFWVHRGGV
jgi:Flp pilus assembly protein protease CpaA